MDPAQDAAVGLRLLQRRRGVDRTLHRGWCRWSAQRPLVGPLGGHRQRCAHRVGRHRPRRPHLGGRPQRPEPRGRPVHLVGRRLPDLGAGADPCTDGGHRPRVLLGPGDLPNGTDVGWCTTRGPRSSRTARKVRTTIDRWSVSCCMPTRRRAGSARSPRCTVVSPGTAAARARTTWQRSSWATTSTPRPAGTSARRCGTTSGTPPTVPRWTSTGRSCTRRPPRPA